MRLLITGGNGYVGRTLVRQLMADHAVTVLDNASPEAVRFAPEELDGFTFLRADIRDRDAVREAVDQAAPDVIVHLAAIHYIPECQRDPGRAVDTNVGGTVNLLDACPAGTRFVFASSAAVYQNSTEALQEDSSPLGPNDIYGATKLQGEHYLAYFAEWRGFPAVAVRLFNVVGPGETNPHVLPEIVAQLKAGRRTLELGTITSRRDFIHVSDAASGFAAIALGGEVPSGDMSVVNLGRGEAHSVSDLIDMLRDVIGEPIDVVSDPSRMRRADNPLLLSDISRIREQFSWKPELDIRRAIDDLWSDPDLPLQLLEKYAI